MIGQIPLPTIRGTNNDLLTKLGVEIEMSINQLPNFNAIFSFL